MIVSLCIKFFSVNKIPANDWIAAATNTPANNSETVSTKQIDKTAVTLTTTDETGITSSSITNDKIQTLTEQTMILHKIIAALSKTLGAKSFTARVLWRPDFFDVIIANF